MYLFNLLFLKFTRFLISWCPLWVSKWFKWFIHRITGKCEIQRILETSFVLEGIRVNYFAFSLKKSRNPVLNGIANSLTEKVDELSTTLCQYKNISHLDSSTTPIIEKIVSYNRLSANLKELKSTKYEESLHEIHLKELWGSLSPDQPYIRRGENWKDLGFQGTDPVTDLRGMGVLGLLQLCYITSENPKFGKDLYSRSNHPSYGFPFAITGINITALLVRLFDNDILRTTLFSRTSVDLNSFNTVYCKIFSDFVRYYQDKKPENIMAFNQILQQFEKNISNRLLDESYCIPQLC